MIQARDRTLTTRGLDRSKRWLAVVDRMIGAVTASSLALVLPVSLLLFLQWPLRELVQAYSREANDLAQWLFALYVSVAITYATRMRSHLAADALARKYAPATRAQLYRLASLSVLVPWSLFMLYATAPMLWQSVSQLERFPETYNAGYFIVKAAVGSLALLVLLQAIVDAFRNHDPDNR
jgi:TRAP-type mannitol/chloroaromatic compound transport system permease small subunit